MFLTIRLFKLAFLCKFFASISTECEYFPDLGSLSKSLSETSSRTLFGNTIGIENVIWSVNDQSVTCTDDAAKYNMTLIQIFKELPADSNLQKEAIIAGLQYFRLEVIGVERILDKGQCLIRDDSDDRVETLIEGSYDPSNYTFTVLSCSNLGLPSNSEIYFSSKDVVTGTISCKYGDQMKKVFLFSNLELH